MRSAQLLAAVLLTAGLALTPARGQNDFDPFNPGGGERAPTTSTLLSEVTAIAPGEPFTVALKLVHPEGWHSYYINPGLLGNPIEIAWDLPEGFSAERVAWPVPHISKMLETMNTFGYEGTVYHLFRITPPPDLAPGSSQTVKLEASWQICDEQSCVNEPESGTRTLSVTLPAADEEQPDPETAEEFAAARAMLPAPLPDDLDVQASDNGQNISILLSPASKVASEDLYFYDEDGQLDAQAKPKVEKSDAGVRLTIPRNKGSDFGEAGPVLDRLTGILTIGEEGYHVDVSFEKEAAPPIKVGTFFLILGGMFLGGMILNLMPCVFPVIGLKIMGFVQQAGEDRGKILTHGLLFAGGVLVSFWALAGFLLALREGLLGATAKGDEVGWGYQLQNPWMIWGLLLVMFILALNMFGVFEIGTSATSVGGKLQRKQGLTGTFLSGVLATIVATPCSAPFLGAAIGATFTYPPFLFMISFTVMALGLAFPYLLLSFFPKLVQKLPRPGPWMESFKQAMSFLLFATAGFLLWVYIGQIETGPMLQVVFGLTGIAIAAWIYGRWCVISKPKRTRLIGFAMTIVFAAGGLLASMPPRGGLPWEDWSQERVDAALEEGRPVYVDFTAQWCLTCQVNKRTAYGDKVKQLIEEYDILLLKADKTKPNPAIDKKIQELGRAAIPVNVLYVPGDDTPHITKEVLTEGYLADFIEKRLGEAGSKQPSKASTAKK